MSLWRPITCRNQMYRSHVDMSTGPTAAYLSSLVQQQHHHQQQQQQQQQQQLQQPAVAETEKHQPSINNNRIQNDSLSPLSANGE